MFVIINRSYVKSHVRDTNRCPAVMFIADKSMGYGPCISLFFSCFTIVTIYFLFAVINKSVSRVIYRFQFPTLSSQTVTTTELWFLVNVQDLVPFRTFNLSLSSWIWTHKRVDSLLRWGQQYELENSRKQRKWLPLNQYKPRLSLSLEPDSSAEAKSQSERVRVHGANKRADVSVSGESPACAQTRFNISHEKNNAMFILIPWVKLKFQFSQVAAHPRSWHLR